MIRIHFPNAAAERRALGFLPGRSSFRTWASGEMLLPAAALPLLALEGIPFIVDGPATYEQALPAIRDVVASPVQ